MRAALKNFFNISATDQRGIWFLLTILIIVQTTRYILPFYFNDHLLPSEQELVYLDEWQKSLKKVTQDNPAYYSSKVENKLILPLELFNPNDYLQEDWEKLGFTEKQASSIIKFKNAIHGFKKPKDISKLYCVPKDYFNQLEPFINLPRGDEKFIQKISEATKSQKSVSIIELNSADSLELLKIRGIGPYWAKRILRFRNQWGGFYQKEQLLNIKGFPDSLYQLVNEKVSVDSMKVERIPINSISLEELNKHPIGWYGVAKTIVNYRDQHGPFQAFSDFKKLYALKPEKIELLVHYVKFE